MLTSEYSIVASAYNVRGEYINPYVSTQIPGEIKWSSAITRLTAHLICDLMSHLVICEQWKEYGHTWHWMSLQRPGVNKWHKLKTSIYIHIKHVPAIQYAIHTQLFGPITFTSLHCSLFNISQGYFEAIYLPQFLSLTEVLLTESLLCITSNLPDQAVRWVHFSKYSILQFYPPPPPLP